MKTKNTLITILLGIYALFGQSTVVFNENYSTNTGWTQINTGVSVTNGQVEAVNATADLTPRRVYKALSKPVISTDNWVIETELMDNSISSQSPLYILGGLTSDSLDPVNICTALSSGCSGVIRPLPVYNTIIYVERNSTQSNTFLRTGVSINNVAALNLDIPITSGVKYYLRLEKQCSKLIYSVFADAARTVHVVGSPLSSSFTITLPDFKFYQTGVITGGGDFRSSSFVVDNTKVTTSPVPAVATCPGFVAVVKAIYPQCVDACDQLIPTECAKITSLLVQNTTLTCLDGIELFTGLVELYCNWNNQLSILPPLPLNLTKLECVGNQLNSLPELPPNLTYLHCDQNKLVNLPDLPPNIVTLRCAMNNIESLPILPLALTRFDCYSNKLVTLPALPSNLTELYCYGNKLIKLPELPSSLTDLKCDHNQLTSLPYLPSRLTGLVCSDNQLTSLPELPSFLQYLVCSNNQLCNIYLPLNSSSPLYSVILSNNKITCLPSQPSSKITIIGLSKDASTGLYPICDYVTKPLVVTKSTDYNPAVEPFLSDSNHCDAIGTLRWCITQANARVGKDTITFDASMNKEIYIDKIRLPNITDSLVFDGKSYLKSTNDTILVNYNSNTPSEALIVQNTVLDLNFIKVKGWNGIGATGAKVEMRNSQLTSYLFGITSSSSSFTIDSCSFAGNNSVAIVSSTDPSSTFNISNSDFTTIGKVAINAKNALVSNSKFTLNTKNIYNPGYTTVITNSNPNTFSGTSSNVNSVRVEIYETNTTGIDAIKYVGYSDVVAGNWNYKAGALDNKTGLTNGVIEKGKSYIAVSSTLTETGEFSDVAIIPACAEKLIVTNILDSGEGSFRTCLECANNRAGKDTITFAIPQAFADASGKYVIKPDTALPEITDSVVIDGFSQSGTKSKLVQINGTKYNTRSLVFKGGIGNSTVKGLVFSDYQSAIYSNGSNNNVEVTENEFNGITESAIRFVFSSNGLIENNTIKSKGKGIEVAGGSKGFLVEKNTITALAEGIYLNGGVSQNKVKGNFIDSTSKGIVVYGSSINNILESNKILNVSNTGIEIQSSSTGNIVQYNTIGKSARYGINLFFGANNNRIIGNQIGVDSSGNNLPIKTEGINLESNSNDNYIKSNVIGNCSGNGVYIKSFRDTLIGNYIGVTKAGLNITNTKNGIYIDYSGGGTAVIGGNETDSPNTLANNLNGVCITKYATDNILLKNLFFNNQNKAINLEKDNGSSQTGNNTKQTPIIKNVIKTAAGYTFNLLTQAKDRGIEIFKSDFDGQAATKYYPSIVTALTTDSTLWKIVVNTVDEVDYFSVTTRDKALNTSELGGALQGCLTVTTTNDLGKGSLREAVACANIHPDTSIIKFNIQDGQSTHTFLPVSTYEPILYSTVIDGLGSEIVIDGTKVVDITNKVVNATYIYGEDVAFCMRLFNKASKYVKLLNLSVKNFKYGVLLQGGVLKADSVKLISNREFGLAVNEDDSVKITNSLISNNLSSGIKSISTTISNFELSRSTVSGNGSHGIDFFYSKGILSFKENNIEDNIGNGLNLDWPSESKIEKNIISGNGKNGIYNGRGGYSEIKGNIIGLTKDLKKANPNKSNGVLLNFTSPMKFDGNIISGNLGYGILSYNSQDTIISNYIGTTPDGGVFGNGLDGIKYFDSSNPLIGQIDKPNYICNNSGYGIFSNGQKNGISYNYIGTNEKGEKLGNGKSGIYIYNPDSITNNIIANNKWHGLEVKYCNNLSNNYIGTNPKGDVLGNDSSGIKILSSGFSKIFGNTISNNTIGIDGKLAITTTIDSNKVFNNYIGVVLNQSNKLLNNTFQNNTTDAVRVLNPFNKISKNIFSQTPTGQKAINLVIQSPTYYGNSNKAKPVINSYKELNDSILITGVAKFKDTVEVFVNDANVQNALRFISSVRANTAGQWSLKIPSGAVYNTNLANYYIATATDSLNNTSELSEPYYVPKHLCLLSKLSSLPSKSGLCYNENVSYTAPDLFKAQYKWFKNDTLLSSSKSITIGKSGRYVSQVVDNYGCVTKDTVQVEANPVPLVADFLIATNVYQNEPIVVVDISYTIPDKLNFDFGNATVVKQSDYYYVTYTDTGTKYITLTSENGYCAKTITRKIEVLPERTNKARAYVTDIKDMVVFPNPSNGEFTLKIDLFKNVKVEASLFELTGSNKVWQGVYEGAMSHSPFINIQSLASGVYYLKVATETDVRTLQIIINK